jgi:23S rRNA (uracil1939-C5)-methyltransferase
MIEYLTKGLNLEGTETVLDLYSGLGTFSMRLAALSKFVLAVEANHVSVKAGKANANINNLKNIKFVESDVEDFLIANENRFDIVVADPPRSGLGSMVISKILEMKPLKIGYISCNPSTMARDLKLFVESGEYEIEVIKPFDMFPQTYHVESLVLIKRKK